MTAKPRVVVVAMSESIHTARWLEQFRGMGWDFHLFPSLDSGTVHPEIEDVTVHHSVYNRRAPVGKNVRQRGIGLPGRAVATLGRIAYHKARSDARAAQLASLVDALRPDLVHSLEIQAAGYLTSAARERVRGRFPTWIVTNWGSDIYLFGRLKDHKERIQRVLSSCDFYSCECERDVPLARAMGFRGEVLPVMPNAGGLDLQEIGGLRSTVPPSRRKVVLVKGYQGVFGRALFAIRALEMCADALAGYTVAIYSAQQAEDVKVAAELLSQNTGITVEILPRCSHTEMLRHQASARVTLGLSISDGISTSLLEAMAMGAFPVQSHTACANEWVTDGVGARLVPPEDLSAVVNALRQALTDDALVDAAAISNAVVVSQRLDRVVLRQQAQGMYTRALGGPAPAALAR